ncbi:uncharacterized protein LOC115628610 [Scaptodrosophila lebanonensis]|uniref:Uncharacterized protein LOC115628610 n=1 Tax=Drosophila lebanonensis TaxID=7225 RepID=A0A6J2TZM5_DROLE|nr:uncharacterized protein LOC115628610 [Scaptodrosophila lebanonensis]
MCANFLQLSQTIELSDRLHLSTGMGNVTERQAYCDEPAVPQTPKTSVSGTTQVVDHEDNSVTFQLFCFKQHLGQKENQLMKWATSKLLLTEKLLKISKNRSGRPLQPRILNTSWNEYDEALLTDDEDDVVTTKNDSLSKELTNLQKYRLELRDTILRVAEDRMKKREKKKLKRLKRRTLISSKKPSKKEKHQSRNVWYASQEQYQTDDMNMIVID